MVSYSLTVIAQATDQSFLRRPTRPDYENAKNAGPAVRVVDLFAGCGGMTLGIAQCAFELGCATDVRLAVDFELAAIRTYAENFGRENTRHSTVEALFNGGSCDQLTTSEAAVRATVGRPLHFLLGGPPCQGHSDLNNHTRRFDRKNSLYIQMARAAKVLNPRVVMIENVPAVLHDRDGVVHETKVLLKEQGYESILRRFEEAIP